MVFMDYKPGIRFLHLSMHIQVSSNFWCAVDWQSLSCPRRSQYVGGAAWSGISWQSRVPFLAVAQVHLEISWVDRETGKAESWWIWHDQDIYLHIYIYIYIYIYICLDYIMKYDVSWSWIVFNLEPPWRAIVLTPVFCIIPLPGRWLPGQGLPCNTGLYVWQCWKGKNNG